MLFCIEDSYKTKIKIEKLLSNNIENYLFRITTRLIAYFLIHTHKKIKHYFSRTSSSNLRPSVNTAI